MAEPRGLTCSYHPTPVAVDKQRTAHANN